MPSPAESLVEALMAPNPVDAIRQLDESGLLGGWLPEFEAGRGFTQPELHHFDVLNHNIATLGALDTALGGGEPGFELRAAIGWVNLDESLEREIGGMPLMALIRLACLVHDIAKPATAVFDDGRLRFPRHGPRGAEVLGERLPGLGFGAEAARFVSTMTRYHLRPGELIRSWPVTDRAVRKFVNDLDGHVLPLMLVNLSDGMATRGPHYTREHYRRHCAFMNYVLARATAVSDEGDPPLVSGDDLIEHLNLESGRLLGAVLTSVRQAQAEGAVSDREEALALARSVLASLQANEQ
jgi:hypothetical protein